MTKHYRVSDKSAYDNVNQAAKEIANKLDSDPVEGMETMANQDEYLTLKDHKENFENRLSNRLIKPVKSEMGKVSKRVFEGINAQIREKAGTLWRSSGVVVKIWSVVREHELERIRTIMVENDYDQATKLEEANEGRPTKTEEQQTSRYLSSMDVRQLARRPTNDPSTC